MLQAHKHVSFAVKKLFGEGTDAAGDWIDATRAALLERGWTGLKDALRQTSFRPAVRPALVGLRNDLGNHVFHLNYADRHAEGQPFLPDR